MKPGLYLTHKPAGPSSFAAMRAFIEATTVPGQRKLPVCHGGTLDPFAEGLLLILVGETTRLMDLHHAAPKEYVAEVVWGIETENGDPFGKVVSEGDARSLTPERLQAALSAFLGWTEQTPPATSAKKIGGEPAYKKVQRGEEVHLPPSRVYLHSAEWLSHELPRRSVLRLTCRGGFYVRALVRDLGRALGPGAHVAKLNRTRIGPWGTPLPGEHRYLSAEELLPWALRRLLNDEERGILRQGHPVPRGVVSPAPWTFPPDYPRDEIPIVGFHLGKLVAVLREEDGNLRPAIALRYGL